MAAFIFLRRRFPVLVSGPPFHILAYFSGGFGLSAGWPRIACAIRSSRNNWGWNSSPRKDRAMAAKLNAVFEEAVRAQLGRGESALSEKSPRHLLEHLTGRQRNILITRTLD